MAGQTLSEQIYDELYHDITDQRLVCGQKLTLKVLKDRFNVSHTPIREALMRLAENGLVTYYSNCGVTVTEFTETDIRQLFQFIGELDSMAILFCQNNFNQVPLLMDLQEERNLTYMFITHDLSVVRHISNQIAVMYLGKCVEYCESKHLFVNPLHPYTKALLSAIPVPSISMRSKKPQLIRGEVTNPINPKPGCRFAARCPFATEECTQGDIPFEEVEPGHFVACLKARTL